LGLDGEIADGTTYLRMPGANMDSNRRGLIDFTQSGHLGKQLDNIPDGATYTRRMSPTGSNYAWDIDNATMALAQAWQNGNNGTFYFQTTSPTPAVGSQYLVLNSSAANGYVEYYKTFPVVPGECLSITALINAVSTVGAFAAINFLDASNAYVSGINTEINSSASWVTEHGSGVVPSNAAKAFLTFNMVGSGYALLNYIAVASNDVRVAGSVAKAYIDFSDNTASGHLNKTVDYIGDGTTYARLLASQLTSGAHNLTVAGSGMQVADQRNLLPILSAGAQAVWQNLSITYTAAAGSPATATISVSAAQILGLQNAGATVDYNASSANVTGTGGTVPTYFLYYIDPAYSGGAQTLYATTTSNDLRQQLGIVYIGSIAVTFPTSGSGGGSGGGGLCVTERMFIRRGRRAVDAIAGEIFDCADFPTRGLERFERALLSMDRGESECVHLIADDGCELECSVTTPFDLLDGGEALAPDMLGERVLTDCGIARIVEVLPIGAHKVCRMHFGGISFAAGLHADRRIYSHNTSTSKP
jgi:hypothetical protein